MGDENSSLDQEAKISTVSERGLEYLLYMVLTSLNAVTHDRVPTMCP